MSPTRAYTRTGVIQENGIAPQVPLERTPPNNHVSTYRSANAIPASEGVEETCQNHIATPAINPDGQQVLNL